LPRKAVVDDARRILETRSRTAAVAQLIAVVSQKRAEQR
jgi:hypothetical protein